MIDWKGGETPRGNLIAFSLLEMSPGKRAPSRQKGKNGYRGNFTVCC